MNIKLNQFIRRFIDDSLYIPLTSKITYLRCLAKHYDNVDYKGIAKPLVIYMADGRTIHGGIADRIEGMVSLFMYAETKGVDFAINFTHPFRLTDYLVPNEYDWTIDEKDICYSKTKSKAFIIKQSRLDSYKYLDRTLQSYIGKTQLHIYTNLYYDTDRFSSYFKKLFKPSGALYKQIEYNRLGINGEYVSVTMRFQQLLGDFKEASFKTLGESDKHALIIKCLDFINKIKNHHPEVEKVLVTSDSVTFLDLASRRFKFVYTIPGIVHHIDYTSEAGHLAYLKSFVDLYMLSEAKHLYNYSTGEMYSQSGFAKVASYIGKKPFTRVIE